MFQVEETILPQITSKKGGRDVDANRCGEEYEEWIS